MKSGIDIASEHRSLLGEGPMWDHERQCLLWVDILNGSIHELEDSGAKKIRTLDVGQMVGTVVVCNDGNFVAALKNGIALVNRKSGEVQIMASPEKHLPGNRFNDGKCDPAGRLWVGSMALSEESGAGSLYMVEPDFKITTKIKDVTISNGLAWTADKKKFYYIDTPTRVVVAYDYDHDSGNISNRREVIRITEGSPDGMTIDIEDNLWIAHWGGWQVSRWDPRSGRKLHTVSLPVERVTSCAFGGADLKDLYITTACTGLNDVQLKEQPKAGMLFVYRSSDSAGTKTNYFNHP